MDSLTEYSPWGRKTSRVRLSDWTTTCIEQYQFSSSVVSDLLRPHEKQHARPLCPSPTPGVHPNPCPLCQWCHPTISPSVVPLFLPSIFPSTRVSSNESALCIRWPKYWSFSFNISPSNEHPGLISNKHIAKYCLSGLLEFWCGEKVYCFRWDWLRCFQPPMLCRKYCFSDTKPCGFWSLDWMFLEVSARWKGSPSCERDETWSWGPSSRLRDPSMVRRW